MPPGRGGCVVGAGGQRGRRRRRMNRFVCGGIAVGLAFGLLGGCARARARDSNPPVVVRTPAPPGDHLGTLLDDLRAISRDNRDDYQAMLRLTARAAWTACSEAEWSVVK